MAEKRYSAVSAKKASGATYTPVELASFVADQMVKTITSLDPGFSKRKKLRILDPAVGDGQLLDSMVARLREALPRSASLEVIGYDLDDRALRKARRRLSRLGAQTTVAIRKGDFLLKANGSTRTKQLFDLVIANPPYVRTQVMGAAESRELAKRFGLTGRVDLYHAFVLAIAKSMRPDAVAGMIVSNRFMSTKSGKGVREAFANEYRVQHVWDFGDTKLFDAAVLPAVIVATGSQLPGKSADNANRNRNKGVRFSSVYETSGSATNIARPRTAENVVAAVARRPTASSSCVRIDDGRELTVQHGRLDTGEDSSQVWRLATRKSNQWLATVRKRTWKLFGDIGSIRVGVKTCADRVFIRDDWDSLGKQQRPELLKRLTTHHVARPFRAKAPGNGKKAKQILYPHRATGKRNGERSGATSQLSIDLDKYPNSKAYLLSHAKTLKSRKYVTNAGRQWYEIWVPQDPAQWKKTKLVFRDIAAEPCFWIDKAGSVINGDCYWMTCDDSKLENLLWLAAAVGNSTFIEQFYDHRFHNKLYAGRRRFLTQYVREFPLPKPSLKRSQQIIEIAKSIHAAPDHKEAPAKMEKVNRLVWQSFGLRPQTYP